MLNSFRLRNLRSFPGEDDAPFVDLKPLTVFIGKNSCGKSSFLRSFPLLRQSVEAKTTGPILWYGSYVDFGAFSEAKKHDSKCEVIFFDFKFSLNMEKIYDPIFRWHRSMKRSPRKGLELTVKLGVTEFKDKTIAKELICIIDGIEYSFHFEDNRKCLFYIDGKEEAISEELGHLTTNKFLPLIGHFIKSNTGAGTRFKDDALSDYFTNELYQNLKIYFQGNTSALTIKEGISRIGIHTREQIKDTLQKVFRTNKTFIRNLDKQEDKICEIVYKATVGIALNDILNARATAERYYRHQDLQVDEIDHTGSNLAMLLRSFSISDNEKFSEWTMKSFGFKVRVEELGLHYALKIQTESDVREYNINDMGFGFSQILPIVTTIWLESTRNSTVRRRYMRDNESLIFAIEQPELHLHPEYQARLARMFASVVSESRKGISKITIIFETHSNTMIDALGDAIEDGDLSEKDVNIVLFNKEHNSSTTKIKFSNFNNEGFLEQWPIGFFSGRS